MTEKKEKPEKLVEISESRMKDYESLARTVLSFVKDKERLETEIKRLNNDINAIGELPYSQT